jgi:ABC-type multidrug transport system fused ATPase/permease subunit
MLGNKLDWTQKLGDAYLAQPKDLMQAVQALQGDKTVIIVAHRLSTVEYCDRLYRLDAGRIVDEGTFDEVMNRSQS